MQFTYSNNSASDAALQYLRDDNAKGLDHLIGICFTACQDLYFPDEFAQYSHAEDTLLGQSESLRDFILSQVFKELQPYRGVSKEDIQKQERSLRYIPRRCRNAILNIIRGCPTCGKRKTKQCSECGRHLTHKETNSGTKDCPQCGLVLKGHSKLACRNGCTTPSARTSLDASYPAGTDVGTLSEYVVRPPKIDVAFEIESCRPDLNSLHPDLCDYVVTLYEHFRNSGTKRDITPTFAKQMGISQKAARALRTKLEKIILDNQHSRLFSWLYNLLAQSSDTMPYLAVTMAPETVSTIRAKREARTLLRQFNNTAPEPDCADDDDSRGSASFIVANDDMRQIAAQDALETELDGASPWSPGCTEEELLEFYEAETLSEVSKEITF
jgi:hypothetical protein